MNNKKGLRRLILNALTLLLPDLGLNQMCILLMANCLWMCFPFSVI